MAEWEAIGLSEVDARVYRRLLRDPGVPVVQHGEALELPEDSVEAAVGRLVAAGLVRAGSEAAPAPVDPRSGLGMLVRERRAALDGVAPDTPQLPPRLRAGPLQAQARRVIRVAGGRHAIQGPPRHQPPCG